MNRAERLRAAVEELAAAGIESPRREARLLWEYAQRLHERTEFSAPQGGSGSLDSMFRSFVTRRAAREPFAYITGAKEFWSLEFEVGPGVLVPRPETETLVAAAAEAFPDRTAPLRVLDLGTGSGCLLVTALTLYPNATGIGIDRSAEALGWARRNLKRHGLEARAALREGDWTQALDDRFDLVLANPPYLTTAEMAARALELLWEPAAALDAGPDGLDAHRALGPALAGVLAPGGRAFVEIGAGQGTGASAALAGAGLEIVGIVPDLAGILRCIVAQLHA